MPYFKSLSGSSDIEKEQQQNRPAYGRDGTCRVSGTALVSAQKTQEYSQMRKPVPRGLWTWMNFLHEVGVLSGPSAWVSTQQGVDHQ